MRSDNIDLKNTEKSGNVKNQNRRQSDKSKNNGNTDPVNKAAQDSVKSETTVNVKSSSVGAGNFNNKHRSGGNKKKNRSSNGGNSNAHAGNNENKPRMGNAPHLKENSSSNNAFTASEQNADKKITDGVNKPMPKKGGGKRKNFSQRNSVKNTGKDSSSSNAAKKKRGGKRPVIHDNFDEIRTHGGNYVQYDYSDSDEIFNKADEADMYVSDPGNYRGISDVQRNSDNSGAVIGRNAVRELIRSGRSIDKIFVRSGDREGSIIVIVAEAASRKIPIAEVSSEKLDAIAGGTGHQGVVAMAAEKQYTDIDGILAIAAERGEIPLVVIADGIEDPQNLGAMIRCAECAGAHGIIIPKRRAAGLTPAVTKASAGAIEHMAIAKVQNIADALEKLKRAGLWIFAAEAGGTPYYDTDFKVPSAIVFGSEGSGVSRLVKERSDFIVSIPMRGHVNSLNVSAAAAVILNHAAYVQRI